MTRLVSSSEQGQLQGANASLVSVTGLIGPAIFTFTFAHFIGHRPGAVELPGTPFFLATAMLLGAVGVAAMATRKPNAGQPA
jgi:DHA1 family tetracycline resistance protein-like MFS transporter